MFSSPIVLPLLLLLSCSLLAIPASCDFYKDIQITWGNDHAKILDSGKQLQLSLDKTCGSGFQSMKEYLYGKIDMQLKLVPGNSAGTVTTYYLSSQGSAHDEIDFEFLGNVTGEPYILHTNIYCQGKGNREQQFYVWFDPTQAFHNYTIVWNPQNIIFLVDGIPIREFKNEESLGVPFPKNQAMRVYGSLWNATWATRGGLVQTNWSNAPFTASYANFNDNNACVWLGSDSSCNSKFPTSASSSNNAWLAQELDGYSRRRLKWVQRKFMIYNYCNDKKRFPQGMPPECAFH